MDEKKIFRCSERSQWRDWLSEHFETEDEVWFVFPNAGSGEKGVPYNDAVEEALCFGWIDGRAGTLDADHQLRRFTPRRKGSGYSRPNIERLIFLDSKSLIHPKIRPSVEQVINSPFEYPQDIIEAIRSDGTAWRNYLSFSEPYRRIRVAYIDAARKRPGEFEKRLSNFIKKTRENKLITGYGGIDRYYGPLSPDRLKAEWKREESIAHIRGWDFSHIRGRYEEDDDLPWDYGAVIRELLTDGMKLLDCDTGGGEFLLSLGHPFRNTSATEGYPPNVRLCEEKLLPLGIDLRECSDASHMPFGDCSFDMIINRHGDFDPAEIRRLLKPEGYFVTQQVGSLNDRELVEALLPGTGLPFPHNSLAEQKKAFEEAGFEILRVGESFRPIVFYDTGALVWFARIIEWEFPSFSVDSCFERLMQVEKTIERNGKISGTAHRYLIAAKKPAEAPDTGTEVNADGTGKELP